MPRPDGPKFKIKTLKRAERIKRLHALGRDRVDKAVLLLSQITRSGMNTTVVIENEINGLCNADISMLMPTLNCIYADGMHGGFDGPVIVLCDVFNPRQLVQGTYLERGFTAGSQTAKCLEELRTVARSMSRNDARAPKKLTLSFSLSTRLLHSVHHRKNLRLNSHQSALLEELMKYGAQTGPELIKSMRDRDNAYADTTNLNNGVASINKKVLETFAVDRFIVSDPYRVSPSVHLKEE